MSIKKPKNLNVVSKVFIPSIKLGEIEKMGLG
jgi:hypothetical protein